MPPRPPTLSGELPEIVARTEDGTLAWTAVIDPTTGETMVWKAPWDDGGALLLSDIEEDGGPSVAFYADDELDMVADEMILRDHADAEDAALLARLVALVARRS